MPRRKKMSVATKIDLLEKFYQINGRVPKQSEELQDGILLGTFLSSLKGGYVRLSEEQQRRLEKMGISIMQIGEEEKEQRIRLLEKFYQIYKRLPNKNEKLSGMEFVAFINHVVRGNISLTDIQLKRLQKLGLRIIETVEMVEERKERKVKLTEEFYQKNGRLPKQNEKAPDGTAIGTFLNSIKQGNSKITNDQYKRLQKIGFCKDYIIREAKKENKIRLIEKFYEEHGQLPKLKEEAEGEKIGTFLVRIRIGEVRISNEQLKRLEQIGFCLQKRRRLTVENKLELIREFGMEYQRLPRRDEKSKDGVAIGKFLYEVKKGYIKLSEENQEKLNKLESEILKVTSLKRSRIIDALKKDRELLLNKKEESKMLIKKYGEN